MNLAMHRWTRALLALLLCGLVPACTGKNSNGTPPSFYPSNTAVTSTVTQQAVVTWSPATDYSGTGITYEVAWSLTAGGEVFGSADSVSGIVGTMVTISPLTTHDIYYFIVRAVDGNGVADANPSETEVACTIM